MRPSSVAAALALVGLSTASGTSAALIHADGTFCTLADAIRSANTNFAFGGCPPGDAQDPDVITLTYDVTLASAEPSSTDIGGARAALPDVTSGITLDGGGHVIRRDPTLACESNDDGADFRLLQVLNGGALTVYSATLSFGCVVDATLAEGGAVLVSGASFATSGATFSGNRVRGTDGSADGSIGPGTAEGGAIFADATSTIDVASSFIENVARGGDDLFGNTDAGSAFGGAIFVESPAALSATGLYCRSNVAQGGAATGSHAGGNAGGGAVNGTLTSLHYASFLLNQALGGSAAAGEGGVAVGGGFNSGIAGPIDNIFVNVNFAIGGSSQTGSGGTAGGGGGALTAGPSGTPTLDRAWFDNNSALGGSSNGGSGGLAVGGGTVVSFAAATLAVTASTWSNNGAVGGGAGAEGGGLCVGCLFGSPALVTLANVTVFGNHVNSFGASLGGGVFANGTLTLGSTTVADNQTFGAGGGIYASGALTLGSSILADNLVGGATLGADCAFAGGTYSSAGHNWLESASGSCPGNGTGDRSGDPALGSFGVHGAGSGIPTLSLLASSLAVDQGSCSAAIAVGTDERGFARPQNLAPSNAADGCDPGAYELFDHDLEIAVVDSVDPVIATAPSASFTDTVTVTNTGFSATTGVAMSVTFSLPQGVSLGSPLASTGAASCNTASCTWTGISLAPGASATLQIPLAVVGDTPLSLIVCTAEVTAVDQSLPGGFPSAQQLTWVLPNTIFDDDLESGTTGAWSPGGP